LTALIERGVRLMLSDSGTGIGHKRVLPPVSSAKGGRNPEFAHLSFGEIEEIEEIERLNRPAKKSAA
jgi:hypothetical protein